MTKIPQNWTKISWEFLSGEHLSCNHAFYPYIRNKYEQWIELEIAQQFRDDKYIYEIKIDNKSVFKKENKHRREFTNVQMYAGDPWHKAAHGKIRKLTITPELGRLIFFQGMAIPGYIHYLLL